jgi:hypothetical protein
MTKPCTKFIVGAAAALFLSACQVEKSASPLSPAVAGPIAGVVISTPNLLEPGQDWTLSSRDQPLKLLFQNADTNGARPLKYSFEVASDSAFKTIVFARTGVEPGDGVTRFQLPDKLAAGTYWWRTKAEDGANSGPYSAVKSFKVLAEVVLAPPVPSSPSSGSSLSDLTPTFKVKAGNRSGVTGDIEYTLQVANNSTFTSIAATFVQGESWPETTFDRNYTFLHGRTYYWRVRARHTTDSELSNWSTGVTFKTPAAPAAPPPPPVGSGGGGGGSAPDPDPSPGNSSSCNSSQGSDIVDCIESRYPQYLVANVSLSRREENTKFLRNKIIEHAKCKGLDVGLNLKRGGPSISVDFIAWRRSGRTEGVDVVSGWDDTKRRLSLSWHTYGPPNYGHPFYKDYGSVSCN